MKDFVVVMNVDKGYLNPLHVFLYSFFQNGKVDHIDFDFYIYTRDIEQEDLKLYSDKITVRNVGDDILMHDLSEMGLLFEPLQNYEHFSISSLRIFTIVEMQLKYRTMIYFDCDMLIRDSIETLFQHLSDDYDIACVYDIFVGDYCRKNDIFCREFYKNFNAGMLVINLEKMSEYGDIYEIFLNSPLTEYYDQDFLNNLIPFERRKYISPKYNALFPIEISYMPLDKMMKAIEFIKNSIVMHFAGQYKPWDSYFKSGVIYEITDERYVSDVNFLSKILILVHDIKGYYECCKEIELVLEKGFVERVKYNLELKNYLWKKENFFPN